MNEPARKSMPTMRRRTRATLSQSGRANPAPVHPPRPSHDGKAEDEGESTVTKSDSKKSGRGRPRVAIDWKVVDGLCKCFCTKQEIAGVLGVHEDTLGARIEEEFGRNFSAYFEQKSAAGRVSLRHKQFDMAMRGNVAMQIWLGKQWLGQRDKVEQLMASDPLEELVSEFRKRNEILSRTPSDEDPIPGEAPPSTIN